MTRNEIERELGYSDRWGINSQPELEYVVDVFETMPITKIKVIDDATIEVETYRQMTQREAFAFCNLHFDDPEEITDDQRKFQLWWD